MKRYIRPRSDPSKTLAFIIVAAGLMVLVKLLLWEWQESFTSSTLSDPAALQASEQHSLENSEVRDFTLASSILDRMESSGSLKDDVFLFVPQPEPIHNKHSAAKETAGIPRPSREDSVFYKSQLPSGQAHVVIIIDDLGMDQTRSYEVLDIDAPLTLAFLPYAPNLYKITKVARDKGHELLIHVPMEPLNDNLDPGPLALLDNMPEEELAENLDRIFESFEGYVGINNHMGSKLTQNGPAMHFVMEALSRRGLFFVDSKTIHTSLAADIAAQHGLGYAERDVFLDHFDNQEAVEQSLARLEEVARRRGVAIGIGHPKDTTIAALKEWLPTLKDKGITVLPVSATLQNRQFMNLASEDSFVIAQ